MKTKITKILVNKVRRFPEKKYNSNNDNTHIRTIDYQHYRIIKSSYRYFIHVIIILLI